MERTIAIAIFAVVACCSFWPVILFVDDATAGFLGAAWGLLVAVSVSIAIARGHLMKRSCPNHWGYRLLFIVLLLYVVGMLALGVVMI